MSELVFVYGTLRAGCGNDHWLEGCRFIGNTVIRNHAMYSLHGGFPGVIEQSDGIVKGEVYEVPSITILDPLEGYRATNPTGGLYNRHLVDTEFGRAWVYLINYDVYGEKIIDWKEFVNG